VSQFCKFQPLIRLKSWFNLLLAPTCPLKYLPGLDKFGYCHNIYRGL
jgi:hypothetical protein